MVKRFSKFVALATTITMLAAPVSVFAANASGDATTSPASGSTTASGELEGWVNKSVFCVELPTVNENDTTFQFRLDPQDLIGETKTDDGKYGVDGLELADSDTSAGLYFIDSDGKFSSTSAALTATNKSSVDVSVSVSATLANATGLTLASSDAFAGVENKNSIYLELAAKNSDGDVSANALADGTAKYEGTLASADADYSVVVSGDGYDYQLDPSATGFDSVDFYLTGACNQAADVDWSKLTNIAPTVTVKWTLKAASTGYLGATSISATSNIVDVTLPDGVTIKSLSLPTGALSTGKNGQYTYANGKLTFTTNFCNNQKGKTVTVTFSDGTTETLSIE
jgi:hypothetical protein